MFQKKILVFDVFTTNNLETSELHFTNYTTHSKGCKCMAKNITPCWIYSAINGETEFCRNFGLKLQPFYYKEKYEAKVAVWFIVHMDGLVHKFLKGCSFDVTTIRSAHMWAVQKRRRRRHMHQKGQCNILCTNSPSMANQKLQFRIVMDVILSFSHSQGNEIATL